jgi:hypothetical protein
MNGDITLPEGSTLAKTWQELGFYLRVARQQGYYGVLPGPGLSVSDRIPVTLGLDAGELASRLHPLVP